MSLTRRIADFSDCASSISMEESDEFDESESDQMEAFLEAVKRHPAIQSIRPVRNSPRWKYPSGFHRIQRHLRFGPSCRVSYPRIVLICASQRRKLEVDLRRISSQSVEVEKDAFDTIPIRDSSGQLDVCVTMTLAVKEKEDAGTVVQRSARRELPYYGLNNSSQPRISSVSYSKDFKTIPAPYPSVHSWRETQRNAMIASTEFQQRRTRRLLHHRE